MLKKRIVTPHSDIRLVDHRGIRTVDLLNLGHINIFAGRNNSGKSAILEAIHGQDSHIMGLRFQAEHVDLLCDCVDIFNRAQEGFKLQTESHTKTLRAVAGSQVVWFANDWPTFKALAIENEFSDVTRGGKSILQLLEETFVGLFQTEFQSAMVPAKRAPVMDPALNYDPKLTANGQDFLNYLHHSKNQLPSKDMRKCFDNVQAAFKELTRGISFELELDPKDHKLILHFSGGKNQWRTADNFGLGLRDILVILTYCNAPEVNLVLIEEPENHLHPDFARRLLSYCGTRKDRQFFIATHSNVFSIRH